MISIHTAKSNLIYQEASEFLINWLRLSHNITQKTLLLLSGGSAVNLYGELAKFLETSDLDFGFLAFGQVDERFHPENPKSEIRNPNKNLNINAEIIKQTGLWESCERKGIPYYLVSQKGSLQESAEGYSKILEKLFKEYTYKIGVLGIGENGHTAGLLPGYAKVWDKENYVMGYRNNGQLKQRISLTPKALKELDYALVIACGEKKRSAIKETIAEENREKLNIYPAAIIQKIKRVDLFTDTELV